MSKKHRINPTVKLFFGKEGGLAEDVFYSCDTRYPFVCTTYRVTEHWQTGVMTRHVPWLMEAQPQMFVEMSNELAKERGIKNGEKVTVSSARGSLWAVADCNRQVQAFQGHEYDDPSGRYPVAFRMAVPGSTEAEARAQIS